MEFCELEKFFEEYITIDMKEEDIAAVVEELNCCLNQNTGENDSKTLDMLPSSSTSLVPPSVPEKPLDLPFNPQIHNVFSTAHLGCKLDLQFIARNVWNTEYNPKVFPALTMRIRKPKCMGRFFASGSLICAGSKSVDESRQAARRFARIVQKLGFPVRLLNFQIQNIMTCCKFFPVCQLKIHQAYSKHCSFNQELFPHLIFRGVPGVTATIFSNGKIILNGPKSIDEVHKAFDDIYSILSCFSKQ